MTPLICIRVTFGRSFSSRVVRSRRPLPLGDLLWLSVNVREHYSKGLSSHYSQEIETGRRERAGGQTASERKEWGRAVVLYSAAGGSK